jgi:hypothetical protein
MDAICGDQQSTGLGVRGPGDLHRRLDPILEDCF